MRQAQTLPQGTFGRAYGDFMAQRGFHADDRPPVRFVNSEELAYVATRNRETHDLWHVLFNCRTTVLGELALKAVEFVQVYTGLHCLLSACSSCCLCIRHFMLKNLSLPPKRCKPTGKEI